MSEPSLGVVFRPQSPPEELRAVALAAEATGAVELWLFEDCFSEGGLTAAAAALAWTENLTVAIGLLPVPLRNPALAAMEIATVARLFSGRLLPGIGHGVLDWMEQVGARAPSPMTLLAEHTSALRELLHGRTVDVEGQYVRLRDVTLDWPPAQVPPVLVGARGPKTIRLAAELGDGVILDTGTRADAVRASCADIAEARAAVGRTEPFRVVVYVQLDEVTPQRVESAAAELGAAGADTVVFLAGDADLDPLPLVEACSAVRG